MRLVIITLHGGFLDGAVHALDLTIGPGMTDLGQPVLDAESVTQTIKRDCPVSFRAFALGELNAVVREDGVDFVRHGFDQVIEKVFGYRARGTGVKLGMGEL